MGLASARYDASKHKPIRALSPALKNYTSVYFTNLSTKQRIQNRQAPVDAFKKYRQTRDPVGVFSTQYLRDMLGY